MMIAIFSAALMGAVLGLLGGGGSILTVPILLYIVKIPPQEAIASSLLIVAITALFGSIQHARAGNVVWRTGLAFSLFAMAGSYAGGRVAGYFSGTTLLLLFAAMMLVTGFAMLRKNSAPVSPIYNPQQAQQFNFKRLLFIAGEGVLVGGFTGLVGAGGGFLVVPALVMLGGMEIKKAIGTSLVVIALKSFAGLAGHLDHITIDYTLALSMSCAAIIGSLFGAALTKKLSPIALRRYFSYFVLAMAVFILTKESTSTMIEAFFISRWPFWAGGTAIALFVLLFLLVGKKTLGVSTGFQDLCQVPFDSTIRKSWRLPFMLGIIIGGAIAGFASGHWDLSTSMGMFDAIYTAQLPLKALIFASGGILIGFGTRLAGGCTSGHGIVGMAQFSPSSIIATCTFMGAGFIITQLIVNVLGGF